MSSILVIYDQLNAELEYCITTDEDFLEFNGAKINGSDTSADIQERLSDKLFEDDGSDKIEWKMFSLINPILIKDIDKIVIIAFLP